MTRPIKKRSIITRFEVILAVMAVVSLAVVLAPRDWLKRSYELYPAQFPLAVTSDTYSGGNSVARWIDKKNAHWECELRSQFQSPYCSMQLSLVDEDGTGVDLSGFSNMTIWMKYKGDARHVRFYMRNRHPRYYKLGHDTTTKYNVVEVPTTGLDHGISIRMRDIKVADWWLAQQNMPPEYSGAEFNDVVYFEVQTGSTSFDGVHEFQLERIRWEGTIITDEDLYRAIVVAWSAVIILLLTMRVVTMRMELTRNRRYQDELVSINRLLNLQNKQFEDLAKTDQLTGLLNRIGIRDALYDGLNDWKARRRPFSFIMIDIDHFKQINDTYGHDVGDAILKGVSTRFRNNVRHTDYLARWGGEEFILVCPETDLAQAQVVAESLRKKLESENVYEDVKVTASFGVASLSQPSLDHLFKCADEALYEAKTEGRNRVVAKF